MKQNTAGFTLVELLVAPVTIEVPPRALRC